MSDSPMKFKVGQEFVIDEDNADSFADVIGHALAKEIKETKLPKTSTAIVTKIDLKRRTVTVSAPKGSK